MKNKQIQTQMNPLYEVQLDLTSLTSHEVAQLAQSVREIARTSALRGELSEEFSALSGQVTAFNQIFNQ
jgi:hypothetical protein